MTNLYQYPRVNHLKQSFTIWPFKEDYIIKMILLRALQSTVTSRVSLFFPQLLFGSSLPCSLSCHVLKTLSTKVGKPEKAPFLWYHLCHRLWLLFYYAHAFRVHRTLHNAEINTCVLSFFRLMCNAWLICSISQQYFTSEDLHYVALMVPLEAPSYGWQLQLDIRIYIKCRSVLPSFYVTLFPASILVL